jgi:hypothetical protein
MITGAAPVPVSPMISTSRVPAAETMSRAKWCSVLWRNAVQGGGGTVSQGEKSPFWFESLPAGLTLTHVIPSSGS